MLKVSEGIASFLNAQSEFTAIMGDRVFPMMALESTPFPFTTYKINEKTPLTKDGSQTNVSLFFWFGPNKYKETIVFTDAMEAIIKEKSNYEWVSSSPDFTEENFSYVGVINLNTN